MIYLYGASGHAKVVIEILEQQQLLISGLIDANPQIKNLLNYSVQTNPENLSGNQSEVIITIGNNAIRKRIAEGLNTHFIKAIHPAANISTRCTIGAGSVVMANTTINSGAIIGKHCILNTNCSVDHDCLLEDYVHISPNAALAGNIKVGEGSHVGIGACVIQGINIGKWATIGAGTVIIRDVPDYAIVVGNPGKIINYNRVHNL